MVLFIPSVPPPFCLCYDFYMNVSPGLINGLLRQAGLSKADEIRHLGHGELNNSYGVRVGSQRYCVRIAKYTDKSGLAREADALSRLPAGIGPRLVYFNPSGSIDDHLWIIESFIPGDTPKRLSLNQFKSMGKKLAQVHTVHAPSKDAVDDGEVTGTRKHLWDHLTWVCRAFYDEDTILNSLPDQRLSTLARSLKAWLDGREHSIDIPARKYLLHKDITPSNVLVQGDECYLIDWELRGFGDPMMEFGTGFWDFDLHKGKWRIALSEAERAALYGGYTSGGGIIDEERIQVWTTLDKMGVALFLCYRIHTPTHDTTEALQHQYKIDLEAAIDSLQKEIKD